jgi:hypothetical protein
VDPEWNRFSGLSTSQQLDEIWNLVTKLGPLAGQVLQLEDILGKYSYTIKKPFRVFFMCKVGMENALSYGLWATDIF